MSRPNRIRALAAIAAPVLAALLLAAPQAAHAQSNIWFPDQVADQSYFVNTAVNLTLPVVSGSGTCSIASVIYSLSPTLPAGLSFTASTRQISGTPTTVTASAEYTYSANDQSCYATASQKFDIAVAAAPEIQLSTTNSGLTEGGANQTYTVRLKSAPASDVTVAVSSGDSGAVTASPASLTFTSTNYSDTQTVTLSAVQDADGSDETVTITHTASGGLTATATLAAAVTDDDKGITFNPTSLEVLEGTSKNYTVVLDAAPSGNLTVTPETAHIATFVVSVSPSSLSFTTQNWNIPQTVTVSVQGNSTRQGNSDQTIRHRTSGGGYGILQANLGLFIRDDENPGLVVSPSTLALTEGGSAGTFTVRMGGNVRIGATATVSVSSGDAGAATVNPTSLTFTSNNANTNQTVTVTPVQDADNTNESVTVTMTASGSGYDRETATVTVTVADDETASTLAASAVTHNSATLTLSDHTGAWHYKYTQPTTPAGTCSTVVSSGTYTANLASLTPGTNYTYKAYSDSNCAIELTSDSTDAEFLTKPGQVTGVTTTAAKGTLTVDWTAPSGTVTGYKVQWKKGDENYDDTRTNTVTDGTTSSITGLTDGTAYSVRVIAYNATGDGPASSEATGTPDSGVVPAPALSVTGGTRTLTATWEHPLPGTSGLTFGVRYRKAGTSTWTSVDASSTTGHQNFGGNVTTTTIPGHEGGTLEDNANYEVQVRGGKWNDGYKGWGGWSGTETAPTLPAAPTKPTLTVTNLGSGKVRIASSVTGAATLTRWEYTKKAGEGNYDSDWTEIASTSSSLSHTVTGLTNGTAYKFKVRAENASGAGAESPESESATPAASATLAASNVQDDTATLTISNHTGDWHYKYTAPSTPAGTCSTAVSNSTTASLTNLTPGTSYTFKAYDDSNCAIELTTSTGAAIFLTRPGQVTGVTATSGATSLAVAWTALSGTVTGYKVQWKQSAEQYNTTRQNTVTTGTTNTITGLTNGTAYTVRVTAYNTTGDGDPSSEATGTPSATFTVTALNPAKAPEGGTATYTIVLNTQPTQDVTVALAKQSGGDDDLTVSPASLTFTNANWNQPQTVTVTAAQDSDLTDGTATIAHTVTSTDSNYSSATIANITVSEADDDATGVLVSETAVTATEGGSPGTYTLRLATLPSADVTIDLARQSGGDADLTFSPAQLTFTVEGWDLPQTVSVSAAHDDDTADGTATITHTATSSDVNYNGIAIPGVTATEDDDDIRAVLSKTAVSVPEGGSATYTVALAGEPTTDVTIAVAKQSGGDDNITVSPASLTFTTTNWGTAQTVTLSAAQDNDNDAGTATITHTATSTDSNFNGMTIPDVTATEADDEAPGVTLSASSLTIAEGSFATYTIVLDSRPTDAVAIALALQSSSGPGITVRPTSLTFTRENWNQAQTLTVTAGEDDDAIDGTATVTHTATSTDPDYNGIAIANVAVAETDNDTAGVTVTTGGEGQIVGLGYINEGGSKSYTVVLDTQPAADVTIAVANRGGVGDDADLKASPATLTFTTSNWNQARTVTVSAGEDDDGLNGFAEFDHTATSTDTDYDGISIWSIRAWEQDNDKVRVSSTSITSTEPGSASYTVVLASQPTANVTLTQRTTRDSGTWTITFTPDNWHTPQTLSVNHLDDPNDDDETYTITLTATSNDSNFNNTPIPSITWRVYDDDSVGLVVSATSLSVAEGSSVTYTAKLRKLPSNNVVVNLSANPGSDSDLTVSPASLTFTTGTWNTTQTVTVTAAQDNDGLDGAAQFVHAGASTNADTDWRGDLKVYANGIPADHVTATENDDETPSVTVSETVVTVDEGGAATYTVKLAVEPVADVTIHLGNRREKEDDDDLTVYPKMLTFTTTDYGTAQTVTVSAAEDDDASNGRAIITHTAQSTGSDYNGIEIGNVAATESDNDSDIDIVMAGVPDQAWHRNEAIGTVTLPTATGGNGTLTYALSPSTLPAGVSYDATAKTLSGTPTATTASRTYTWTATDEDGDTASQSFTIEVSGPNTAPTSANATLSVSRDNRTAIPLSSLTYADADGHSLRAIRIVTLPGASDGTLGTVKTGIYDGAGAASTVLCVGTIDAVAAGQEIPDVLSTALYFCPKDGFKSATFGFKVIDSEGRASDKTYTATLVAPPGQVTGLTATAGNAYVRLSWTDPQNPAITGYEYRRKAGVGDWGGWTAMTGSGAATTSHSVSGLTNATAYTFQVRARTGAGAGDIDSAEVSATPSASASVPAKPTGLQVLNQGAAEGETYVQVRLIWNDPKDPSIIRYEAEREFSGSKGNWLNPIIDSSGNIASNNHIAGSGPTTTSAQFRAGSNETTYAFRVRAVNAAGNGPWSDTVSLELSTDGITPVLTALEPGNGRVRLRWTHDGTNLVSEGAYWGYCSGPPDTCTSTNIPSSQANAAARSHVLSGLTNGSTYTYAIYSFASPAADGVSRDRLVSNSRTITLPAAPAKPTGLTASATADGASLAWTDPNSAIITGYEYRYKVGSAGTWGAWTRVPGSDGATTSASVSGVGGTTYKFQVRALIEYAAALGGTLAGAASDEASVSPVSVVVSADSLALTEGGSGSYTVALGDAPTGNVVITVTVDSDGTVTADTDEGTTGDQNTLTFTKDNWSIAQKVTVSAAEDDDGANSAATIAHAVKDADTADARYDELDSLPGLKVAVTDNDGIGLMLSKTNLTVTEGGTETYTVSLNSKPDADVTVTISRGSGGDSDLTVDTDSGTEGNQNTLTFTKDNYATAQEVKVAAAADGDILHGTAEFTHEAAGGGYGGESETLAAAELDSGAPALTVSGVTHNAATLNLANHTGDWYYKYTAPADPPGGCSLAVSTGTKNLTNLATGTAWTYRAYSDSQCAVELDDVSFTTKPAKVTGVTVSPRNGRLHVSWTAESGSAATTYDLQWKSPTSSFATSNSVRTTASSVTIPPILPPPVVLVPLTNGTQYTVRVRAFNSNDGNGEWSDEATGTPNPESLTAGGIGADTATLTIGNYGGTWHYKQTAPSAGACSAGVIGTTASLTNLATGTSHTYRAYSDSQCSIELGSAGSARATFLTKPGQTTNVLAANGEQQIAVSWSAVTGATGYKVQWKSGSDEYASSREATVSSGTSHTITALTNNTAYTIRVAATNATGDGAWSAEVGATPSNVTLTAATHGTSGGTLTISNHTAAWWFKRTTPTGDSTCHAVVANDPTGDLTGLSPGTTYQYKAYSASTCADANLLAASAPVLTTPAEVTGVGTTLLSTALAVSWNAVTSADSYTIEWAAGGNFAGSSTQATVTGTSYRITGLNFSTAYSLRVKATNTTGDGVWSATSVHTTLGAVTLSASKANVQTTTATLTIANHPDAWHYKQTLPSAGACSTAVAAGTTTASVANLKDNTNYTFKAYSDSQCATELTSATTDADFVTRPVKVGTVTVNTGISELDLSWPQVRGGTTTQYRVQWKSSGQQWSTTREATVGDAATTTYTIANLTNDTQYTIRVAAGNDTGDGPWSNEATGTPRAQDLSVTNITRTSATVTLNSYTGDWWYNKEGGGTTPPTCTAVSGSTAVTLDNLTPGTSYPFTAWGTSACGTANAASLAEVTFTTLPEATLRASAVTATTATLTVGNHTAAWWYKRTAPSGDSTCHSVVANDATDDLSGLASGTSHTYKAYSNSSCSTELASETFRTALGQVTNVRLTAEPTSLMVNWSAATSATGYRIEWKLDSAQFTGSPAGATRGGDNTRYRIAGLTTDTAYTVRVRATNASETGAWSSDASGTPGGTGLSVKELTKNSAKLTVSGHTGNWWWRGAGNDCSGGAGIADDGEMALTDLTPETSYTVYAYDNAECGSTSTAFANLTFTTRGLATLSASSVEHGSATLTITDHSGDWHYKYTSPTGGTCSTDAVSGSSTSVTGLAGNTSYTFKAYAGSGCTSELAEETLLTKPAKPGKPTAAPGAGSGKLTLASTLTGGGGALTKWEYTTDDGANWTDITSDTDNNLSYVVASLTDGTNYTFKVRATNATGTGPISDASDAAAPLDETLTASSVEHASATITIANYPGSWYYKQTAPSAGTCSTDSVSGNSGVSLTGLAGNTSYTWKAYSDSSCTSTKVLAEETFLTRPAKPTKPTATAGAGSGKITLSSSITGGSGALTRWEYTTDDGVNWSNISDTDNTLNQTVSGFTDGTSYDIKVRARNATGPGPKSDAADSVTPLDETLAGSDVEHNTATLEIDNYSGDWYYKANAAPDTSCSNTAVSTTSVDLSNLVGNTSYTYSAYSDSGCTSSKLLATASAFLTKPAKPSKPTALPGAGSGKLTLTSTLTGGTGALEKWQYTTDDGTNWTDISDTDNNLSYVVSSLTDGTSYTFKVRAENATGTGPKSDASDSATPVNTTLTATNIAATTATLTIGNWTPDWHYKANAAPYASCSTNAVSGNSGVSLTGLTANASYTFSVYSDSSCSTTALASKTFVTLPPKAATPTVTVSNLGTGKVKVSASVSGTETLEKWQYQKNENGGAFGSWTDISETSRTLEHTFSGLTDGTAYRFKVKAKNSQGFGAASNQSAAATPRAISLASSNVGSGSATLTITNWSGDWYHQYTAPDGGSCADTAVSTSSTAVTGLTPATTYTFKAYSDSDCSTVIATAPDFTTTPAKVTNVGAASRHKSLEVGWTAVTGATGYKVQWKTSGQQWSTTRQATVSGGTTATYTITGLTNGTTYSIRVLATGTGGESLWSDTVTGTPSRETLTVSDIETTSATLTIANWGDDWHYKYTAPSGGQCSSAVSTLAASVTGLDKGTTYSFKAYSDSNCSAAKEIASAGNFTTKPAKVTGLEVGGRHKSLFVTWTAATGAASYTVQYRVSSDDWDPSRWQTSVTTNYVTLSGLDNGVDHTVRVRAVTSGGDGEWSDPEEGAPAAATLTVIQVEATSAILAIDNAPGKWYYAHYGGSCTPVQTGYKVDLANLETATSYTFKAYSDVDCSTVMATADAFTTKPGKVAGVKTVSSDQAVKVTWTAQSGNVTGYKVQWKSGSQNWDAANRQATETTTAKVLSSLSNNTVHTIRVAATNATGDGAWSDEVRALPNDIALSVENITATSAKLKIANFPLAFWHQGNQPGAQCASVSAGATEVDLTNLASGAQHVYTVHFASGCAAATQFGSFTFKTLSAGGGFGGGGGGGGGGGAGSTPSAPTALAAAAGDGLAALTWTPGDAGGLRINEYEYRQRESGGEWGAWTDICTVDDDDCATRTGHTVTGLANGTAYTFQVRAVNARGAGEASAESNEAIPSAGAVDEAPGKPAVSVDGRSVTLSWTAPAEPAAPIASWQYRKVAAGEPWETRWTDIPGSGPATTGHTVTGLARGAVYRFQVRVVHAGGPGLASPASDPAEIAATAPAAPSKPSVTPGDGSVALIWTAGDDGGSPIVGWQFAVQTGVTVAETDETGWVGWTDWKDIPGSGADTTAARVTGLVNGLPYWFRVRAVNAVGAGAPSPDSDAAIPGAAPEAPSKPAVEAAYASATLTWTAAGDGGSPILAWEYRQRTAGAAWSAWTNICTESNSPANGRAAGSANLAIKSSGGGAANGSAGGSAIAATGGLATGSANGSATVAVHPGDGRCTATTRHTVGGLTNGTAYTFQVRAVNAIGAGAASVESEPARPVDAVPDFGGQAIPDLRLVRGQIVEPLVLPAAAGGNGALTYALSGELPAGLTFDPATRVLGGLPTQAMAARVYEYTATDSDLGEPDVAALTFTIEVEVSAADRAVLNDALAAQGRAYLTSATSAIGERFRAPAAAPATAAAGCPEARDGEASGADCAAGQGRAVAAFTAFAGWLAGQAGQAGGMSPAGGWGGGWAGGLATGAVGGAYPAGGMASGASRSAMPAAGSRAASSEAGGTYSSSVGASAGALGHGAGASHGGGTSHGAGAGGTFGGPAGSAGPFGGAGGPFGAGGAFGTRRPNLDRAGQRDWNLGALLQGRSFAVPLNFQDDDGEAGDDPATQRQWTLWGAADAQAFDNPAEAGRYDGGVASLFLGIDGRFAGGKALAGAALSVSRGETDYSANGRTGRLETSLAGFHPYVRGETDSGLELWLIGGVGAGEAEDRPGVIAVPLGPADGSGAAGSGAGAAGAPVGSVDPAGLGGAVVETADLEMTMAAAGLRRPLRQRGAVEFALVAGLGMVTLSTDEGEFGGLRAVDGLDAEVSQGRLGIEISRAGDGVLPYLRLGARGDGGDGVTGAGLEAVAGLRYGGARVDFEAQLRWLGAYSGDDYEDYEEYGGMLRLTIKAREDGSGPRFSLAPVWGQLGGGALLGSGDGLLGGPGGLSLAGGMAGGGSGLLGGAGHGALTGLGAMSLDSEFGYGFAFERGLLTLGGIHRRDGLTVREFLSLDWTPSETATGIWRGLTLHVGYELPTATLEGGPVLELDYAARF